MKTPFILATASVLFSTLTAAETFRDPGAHVHGGAAINVVVDNNDVFIELETPWENLVGFEHAPSTQAQLDAVDAAIHQLESPEEIFSIDGGDCQLEHVDIDSSLHTGADDHSDHTTTADENHDSHDAEDDASHKETEHHADNDDDHARADHDEESGHTDTHSEVLAAYEFTCDDANSISTIEVKLFSLWPGMDEIDVQLLGRAGQTGVELNASNSTIDISSVQ